MRLWNGKVVASVCVLCGISLAAAETAVSHVVVNQRWPWSEKVDVDFTLTGVTNDVEITARWDAHPEPYRLGMVFAAAPGHHRLTWDPAASPFAGQVLTGFTVSVSNVASSAHAYLVVDLVNGGYEFMSAPPSGGWTEANKSTNMVFRRIPAGTYTLGEAQATYDHLEQSSPAYYATIQNRRTVTFTSDFYVGVFMYTKAQHASLGFETSGTADTKPQELSYNTLRGEKPTIDWPTTGYRVAANTVVDKLRAKAEGLVVDLCEEEQWEVAARAGTMTFWPTGGTTGETFSDHTNQVNGFVAWYGNTGSTAQKDVGTVADNGWGLYDVVGLGGEWTLDTAANNRSLPTAGLPDAATDPIGVTGYPYRVLRSASGNAVLTQLRELLPCRRQMADPSVPNYSTRFCIHLKPLGSLTFEGE